MSRIWNKVLVGAFVVALMLPLIGFMLVDEEREAAIEDAERRPLAAFPKAGDGLFDTLPLTRGFEAYFTDRLGFRRMLVGHYSALKLRLLGESSQKRVLAGRDRWLFIGGNPAVADHRRIRTISYKNLEAWGRKLEGQQQWLKARGIRYLFVPIPNKITMYPEFAPPELTRVGDTLRPLERLVAYLKSNTNVNILDITPGLMAAKRELLLYGRTDTHWTDLGAYIGYRHIAEWLSRWYPAVSPEPPGAFAMQVSETPGGGLSRMLGSRTLIPETDNIKLRLSAGYCAKDVTPNLAPLSPIPYPTFRQPFSRACDRAGLPRGVVFGDSFTNALEKFLSEQFSRVTYVRGMYSQADMEALLAKEPIDVVIELKVERYLPHARVLREYGTEKQPRQPEDAQAVVGEE
ncbi:MAG: hypothetical protein ACE5FN_11845 [Leptospirillia bacterium]